MILSGKCGIQSRDRTISQGVMPLSMDTKNLHITDLFKNFAKVQQELLRDCQSEMRQGVNGRFDRLLAHWSFQTGSSVLRRALLDPYFPLGMLEQTVFADVDGMRFYINKRRLDLEPGLTEELKKWSAAFLRIRLDIQKLFDPETITCVPLDGKRHQLPTGQWCTLCGVCCQIGGVPPLPPAGVRYPDYWNTYLAGGAVNNQQLCPFLFQYFGEQRFFCAIHNIKPIACRQFGEEECHRRLAERGLHQYHVTHA